MRLLITDKIYRAFAELDDYTDEQCERFLSSVRRSVWFQIWHRVVLLVAGAILAAVSAVGGGILGSFAGTALFPGANDPQSVGVAVGMLLCLSVSGVVLLRLRDRILRRRILWLLENRARCAACDYSLVGLSVSDDFKVICPECGSPTRVDPSLGELVRDEAGKSSFQPAGSSGGPTHTSTLPDA